MRFHACTRATACRFVRRSPVRSAAAALVLCAAAAPGARAAEGSGAAWQAIGHPIFDIAGGHSAAGIEGENGAAIDVLALVLALDAKGKIAGSGSASIEFPGGVPAAVSFTASGAISSVRGAYGTARVALALKKFAAAAPYTRCAGALSATLTVSGAGAAMFGTIKGSVTATDAAGQKLVLKIAPCDLVLVPAVAPPPSDVWRLDLSLVHTGTKRAGTALVSLASGRELSCSASGKHAASAGRTSMSLKGTGAARGVSLTGSIAGGLLALKGKALGQTISVASLAPRIAIGATLRGEAVQLCDGGAECGDAIVYGIPCELAVDSPAGALAGGRLTMAAPQGAAEMALDGGFCGMWEWRSCSLDAGALRLESEQLLEGSDSAWDVTYTAADTSGFSAAVRLLVDNPDFASPRSGLSITVQQTDAIVDAGGGEYGIPLFVAIRDDNRALRGGSLAVTGPEEAVELPIDAEFCARWSSADCSAGDGALLASAVYFVHGAPPRGTISFKVTNRLGRKAAAVLRFPPPADLPDLVVWPVVPAAAEIKRGQELGFSYTMRNEGAACRAKVSTFDVTAYLSADAILDPADLPLDGGYAAWQGRIGAGWSAAVAEKAPIAWDVPDGLYHLIVCIDAAPGRPPSFYPGVLETNERNNRRASDTRIRVAGGVTMPDLIVASVVPDASEVRRGEELTFTYVVANIGAEGPAGNSLFDTAVYLSIDGVLDASDIELAGGYRAWSRHLDRGLRQRTNGVALIGDEIPYGEYRVIVVADAKPGQAPDFLPGVAEADEGNNVRASAGTVRVVPPPPSPKGTYFVAFGAELFWTLALAESSGGWDAMLASPGGGAAAGTGVLSGTKMTITLADPPGAMTLAFAKGWGSFTGSLQVAAGAGTVTGFMSGAKAAPATLDLDPGAAPPKFVAADFVPRDAVARLTRFRSGIGRNVPDDFESCRHMGHYFRFCSSVDPRAEKIASPVDGVIAGSTRGPRGTTICIRSTQYPAIHFVLEYVAPAFTPAAGVKVARGQVLGSPFAADSEMSILVWIMTPAGNRLVSFFEVMTDAFFVGYECCGVASRAALIISKAERDAHPLACSGDTFIGVDPLVTTVSLGCCRPPTETFLLPGNVPLRMVYCPAGTFMMGCNPGEEGSLADESPRHQVTLSAGFWLGKTEVTKLQWYAVMKTAPWSKQPYVLNDPDSPVVYVSWNDAHNFILKLNALSGKTFHLPTEAQWEYACRATTTARYYWGDDLDGARIGACAWYHGSAAAIDEPYAHTAGRLAPNVWGLCDMSGNACEWCRDWYGPYTAAAVIDPAGPVAGTVRVLRGGAWYDPGASCRSAARHGAAPTAGFSDVGFRVAR